MKICDIVQFYSELGGGVKRYIDDKIRYFAHQPDIEHVVIVPSDRDAETTCGGSRIHEIKSMRLVGSDSYRLLVSRQRIRRIIEAERPDLIEVGDPYHTAWIAQGIARAASIPVVAYYHSDYPRAFGRTLSRFCGKPIGNLAETAITHYLTRLYNRMDATVVATPVLETLLRDIGIQRIIQVPLGTDVERFHPTDRRMQVLNDLGLPPDAKLLLYVGRMAREKNVVNLVHMMDRFDPSSKTALLLIGDGEQGRLVQRMARHRGNVFWHPYCNSPELLSVFYSAADAFVHAGTCETFGLVSLEAQACGVPVVVVKDGGVESTLRHEPHPAIATSAEPDDLHAAVLQLLGRNESTQDRVARRERIVRHFSKETTCRRMTNLYELVCIGHNALAVEPATLFHSVEIPG